MTEPSLPTWATAAWLTWFRRTVREAAEHERRRSRASVMADLDGMLHAGWLTPSQHAELRAGLERGNAPRSV